MAYSYSSDEESSREEGELLTERPFVDPIRTLHQYEKKVFDHEVVAWVLFKDHLEIVAALRKKKGKKTTDDALWEAIWNELSSLVINFYGSSFRYFGTNWDLFHLVALAFLGDNYPTDDHWPHYTHRLDCKKEIDSLFQRFKAGKIDATGRDALTIHRSDYPIISTVLAILSSDFRRFTDDVNNDEWKPFVKVI